MYCDCIYLILYIKEVKRENFTLPNFEGFKKVWPFLMTVLKILMTAGQPCLKWHSSNAFDYMKYWILCLKPFSPCQNEIPINHTFTHS